jgi:hypothetical protein
MAHRGDNNRSRTGALALGLFLALGIPDVGAQDRAPQSVEIAPAESERVSSPGLFERMGRWLDRSARNFGDQLRGAKARVDDLNERAAANNKEMSERAAEVGKSAADATLGAVEAVARLPGTRVMSGRERCAVAPNGAPDCIVAADALCRKHGFTSGKSIDFTSAEECAPRVLLGDRPAEGECRTVTFISRAMCQ